MSKWQDAHVGTDSTFTGFRTTEEEKERLEELRQELRLTSKGQVLRFALDLLEQLDVATERVIGGDVQESRRIARRARRAVGVPRLADLEAAAADDAVAKNKRLKTSLKHVVGKPDANVGLPDMAPAADPQREAG